METEGHDRVPASLSVKSRRLRPSRRRLRRAVKRGELAAFRPGSRTCYVARPGVLRLLREQRVAPCDHANARVAEIMKRTEGPRAHPGASHDG